MTMPHAEPVADYAMPFQIEGADIRGRLVRLGPALDEVILRHGYQEPVARLLAESITLTAAIASNLKFQGGFTFQARGDGPVGLLVADYFTPGLLRGYASVKDEALAHWRASHGSKSADLKTLLGDGLLAFTVDQGAQMERYQGIVPLEGATLTDCVETYFRQSEQLPTRFRMAVGQDGAGRWHGACLMLQRMPGDGGIHIERSAAEREEDWNRATIFLDSVRDDELLDRTITAHALLYRLFHEDGVRVWDKDGLSHGCSCSTERALVILRNFDEAEWNDMREPDGKIHMQCQFCSRDYAFTLEEVRGAP